MELLTTFFSYVGIVFILVSTVFLLATYLKDNSIMDICYGPIFVLASWSTYSLSDNKSTLALIVVIAVSLWGLRLGVRIGRKNIGTEEDARYKKWRTDWMKRSYTYFLLRSYLQVSLLQGLIISVVSLPVILLIAYPTPLSVLPYIGLSIFAFGLVYETVADWQLDRFIKMKKKGKTNQNLMTQGLFSFSRRPNYFGEITLWWGLAITALSAPYGYIATLGAITITVVIVYITGPMLERQFLNRYKKEYETYMNSTSYIIPLP